MRLYSCTFRAAFQEGFRFFHAKCSEALCGAKSLAGYLHILILFALGEQEDDGDGRGENFCGGDGVPDAVHVEQERQQEDGGGLENKRPQEGDGSGDEAVIERREERGREDIEARKQKRE